MTRTLRIFGVFIAMIACANCVTSKNGVSVEAKIISVQSQKYRGGQKGTPSGIKYKLLVIAPGNQNEFKTVGFWINGKFAPAQAYRNKLGVNKSLFEKGDTVTVSANFINTKDGYVYQDSAQNIVLPSETKEKVVLLYTLKNQKKYVGSNEITELEEQLRP